MTKYLQSVSIAAVALMALTSVGCDRGQRSDRVTANVDNVVEDPADDPTNAAEEEQDDGKANADDDEEFYYSPFVVHLDSKQFDTVSFKDVGLDREAPAPHDPLLETISQAFVYEVGNHTDLNYEGEVVYDERILDPSNHLYCGERHLYIDVWRAESPDRWGYSMWSGCGESDNFAWEEVEVDVDQNTSLTDEVSPLAESIAERLAEAEESNCFTKTC